MLNGCDRFNHLIMFDFYTTELQLQPSVENVQLLGCSSNHDVGLEAQAKLLSRLLLKHIRISFQIKANCTATNVGNSDTLCRLAVFVIQAKERMVSLRKVCVIIYHP